MEVAVIGGSGFIGTVLVKKLLEENISVRILDKNKSLFYPDLWEKVDVRFIETLLINLSGIDIVINLAAEHKDDVKPKSLYYEVNVKGAKNVCNACAQLGIKKIIFTSSVAVYGFAPIGTDETGKFNAFNEYGKTKMLAEKEYEKWFYEKPGRNLDIVRPTVVFGERNRGNVYNLLTQIVSGRFIMIGNGDNVKSMAYVENVSAFLIYLSKFTFGMNIYNYVDKPDFDMNTLINETNKILGRRKKNRIHIPYFIGLSVGYIFDIFSFLTGKKLSISSIRIRKFCANTMFKSKNISNTSFFPPITLKEALKRTINYEFIKKM